jgi:hypothetical protein
MLFLAAERNKREAAAELIDRGPPERAAVRVNAGLDGPRTESGVADPPPMEIGPLCPADVAPA